MAVVLRGPRVVLADAVLTPGWLRVDGDRITAVGADDPPAGVDVVDLPTGWLAPGFVDLQCNGGFGVEFATASEEQWSAVLARLPATGVTTVAPTVVSAPVEDLAAAIGRHAGRVRAPQRSRAVVARTLGLHVEGPFLASERRGAHAATSLCDPDPARVDALLAAGGHHAMAIVTLAPERRGALPAIRRLVAAGVTVGLGHTDAAEDAARDALDAGATMVTHLFNAQRPFRHRDPGVVGVALTDPRCVCGLIVDGVHVTPTAVLLAFAAAAGRIALVTDAAPAMGAPPGPTSLGGAVSWHAAAQPPRREDGTIAGSSLTMDRAVANAVAYGVDVPTAVRAASQVPADAVGRRDIGRLRPGATADLVWLTDDLRVGATWVGGRRYRPPAPRHDRATGI